jgi:hypothetical protein
MVQTALTNQNRINSALLGQFQSLLRFRSEECFNNGPPARWEWRSHLAGLANRRISQVT